MSVTRFLNVETLQDPRLYSERQIDMALSVAYWLGRGTLVLALEPDKS